MTVNFQDVRSQVQELGARAPARQRQLQELRLTAQHLLDTNSAEIEALRSKVNHVVETIDPGLRCALPVDEYLAAHFPLQELPEKSVILAADGSQIAPDRQAPVEFCMVNVGSILMSRGLSQEQSAPAITIESRLYYDQDLYTLSGTLTDARLALMRDLRERELLARQVEFLLRADERIGSGLIPVITFTDGQMELWGSVEAENASAFQQSLENYLSALSRLCELGAITAGYVDKPASNLVVRLLEVAMLDQESLADIKHSFPLRGVTDIELYRKRLRPGERSAVFALQSHSARQYRGALGLHFFYLNVGQADHPWLARVEVPAWVARDASKLSCLQAVLVEQCRAMGRRPYPYLLHRAHETALVSLEEKEQVSTMIALELRRQGVEVGEQSQKQAAKDLDRRTTYGGNR